MQFTRLVKSLRSKNYIFFLFGISCASLMTPQEAIVISHQSEQGYKDSQFLIG